MECKQIQFKPFFKTLKRLFETTTYQQKLNTILVYEKMLKIIFYEKSGTLIAACN